MRPTLRALLLGAPIVAMLLPRPARPWVSPYPAGVTPGFHPDGDLIVMSSGVFGAAVSIDKVFGAIRWTTPIPLGVAYSVAHAAFDPAGDVVAVGQGFSTDYGIAVFKLDGNSGAIEWQAVIGADEPLTETASAIAIDATGDVVIGGYVDYTLNLANFAVVKVSGIDGTELWRHVIDDGTFSHALDVRALPGGDVLAVGVTNQGSAPAYAGDLTVLRLDGATGAEVWRRDLTVTPTSRAAGTSVAVDATGQVVVGGYSADLVSGGLTFFVVKLAGTDGTELWRHDGTSEGLGFVREVVVDGAGDVYACGEQIAKLATNTGALLWSRPDGCRDVVVGPGGDLIASGGEAYEVEVLKLAPATGDTLWLRKEPDVGGRLAIDAAGDVASVGNTAVMAGVMMLAGVTGELQLLPDATVRCQQALDKAGATYLKKRLLLLSKCRDAIGTGGLVLDPAQCATEPVTAQALAALGAKTRSKIALDCSDAELGALAACDATLDGVITPAGDAGCLIAAHDAQADSLLAASYGTASPPLAPATATCQQTIAKAGGKYATVRFKAERKRVEDLLKGKATVSPYDLPNLTRSFAVAVKQRAILQLRCTDALVGSLMPCAGTIDGLIAADGTAGCLVDAGDAAVVGAFDSLYDP